ncbi:hypothetical protein [Desulfovibrio sp. DV]|uniref:hypothetical protein n=1 Tax=Desulfovibrio sp. DV TaxID=1844708 RepID=UPI000AD17BC5|nr:hypothetical protein [Desulfovibrio sp. DV]
MSSPQPNFCPICLCANNVTCKNFRTQRDSYGFYCQACGSFEITESAYVSFFENGTSKLTPVQRRCLSHSLCTYRDTYEAIIITTSWIEKFLINCYLPTASIQASNLIRLLGDKVRETGVGHFIDDVIDSVRIGAFNVPMFNNLRLELEKYGLIQPLECDTIPNPRSPGFIKGDRYGLTLKGWERYEAERQGLVAGKYGFIAMKFGDATLDKFISDIIKPVVKESINYDLIDLRDVARAGIIDNIMREKIRDSAFVIADLTHDNYGAYWEAGYAEGLGKPVIYLCEKTKFDNAKTHFDTNHCTTVLWSEGDHELSSAELVATLRRSLNLFPSSKSI